MTQTKLDKFFTIFPNTNNNSKKLTVTSGLISSIISGYIGYLATKKIKNYLE